MCLFFVTLCLRSFHNSHVSLFPSHFAYVHFTIDMCLSHSGCCCSVTFLLTALFFLPQSFADFFLSCPSLLFSQVLAEGSVFLSRPSFLFSHLFAGGSVFLSHPSLLFSHLFADGSVFLTRPSLLSRFCWQLLKFFLLILGYVCPCFNMYFNWSLCDSREVNRTRVLWWFRLLRVGRPMAQTRAAAIKYRQIKEA